MKNTVIILLAALLAAGCGKHPAPKSILAEINNYQISQEEFNEEFKMSSYSKPGSLELKKEFLNNLISRKLVLQDAQARNLDKDPEFLKSVERFWEQSLLKIALEKKSKEIADKKQGSQLMNKWIDDLHKEANIKINNDLLKQDK